MLTKRIYDILVSINDVIQSVGVDNVHLQANEDEQNNYVTSSPMITYADIGESYSKAKVHTLYQVTVWSKSKLESENIAQSIKIEFDMVRDQQYNFSRIIGKSPIFDTTEKMHGTALTLSVVSRKFAIS